jgi:hypothetical protein
MGWNVGKQKIEVKDKVDEKPVGICGKLEKIHRCAMSIHGSSSIA